MNRNVWHSGGAGAVEALPTKASVDTSEDMRSAEVAVGGVQDVLASRIEGHRRDPAIPWASRLERDRTGGRVLVVR